ncbi:MAG TPA: UPF0182 family protein [Actinomycetota bacterium]|nr:UPF0182 family protein [Actinomycetota bacterium]
MARTNGARRLRRRWLLWTIAALVVLGAVLGALSGFYIDILWFREVRYSSVFWTRFWSRVGLALVFGLVFFALMYVNLLIVRAIRPRYRPFSPEEEMLERYRAAFEPYVRWLLPAVSLLFAVFAAAGVAGQWETFQLWRASGGVAVGTEDPVFFRDAAFYLLSLPFQQFVQSWLFTSLIVITLATAAAHYLWGGIRLRAAADRVTPQVKAHLSVLLGLIVLVRAWGYRLGQFDLLFSERGTVTGASYTDVNAQLPALKLLVVISIVAAVLFLVNIRLRGWALPVLALGLLVLASVVAGAIYPAIVQRFRVAPQELQQERPFIRHNIRFTRMAFGLDDVREQSFDAEPQVTPEELEAANTTVSNLRLWNPDTLRNAYLQLQRIRPYYEFTDVDVDRYEIDGQRRLVMLSVRNIDQTGIPGGGRTWQNQHLVYTHGFGAAASRVDQVTPAGAPAFVLRDIPPVGSLTEELEQPRVYFQDDSSVPYVAVDTGTQELDYPVGQNGQEELTEYTGEGGIDVGGFVRRLAFAWRYRDVNLLISNLITSESRMLINVDLPTRVTKIAPFLQYDHDPYGAIVDGRFVWIWDAYTVSDTFPYSERVDLPTMTGGALSGQANYIRNSVKVVVDAFDGTTTFYRMEEDDPIVEAWSRVFPGLFTPVSEASLDLRAHFRYPENLFQVQAHQYANYHVTNPDQFYQKEDFWAVPRVARNPQEDPSELEPYYVLLTLPGQTEEKFLLFVPFTPADRPNMVGWLAASGDPEDYGEMMSFEFSAENVTGPAQATALISQDTEVSREVSLFDQLGSDVIYGDILAIPIGESFLYIQPLYLQSSQEETAIPEMKRIVVVNGERVAFGASLAETLALAIGEAPPEEEPTPPDEEPTPPPEDEPGPPADVAELLLEAERHFEAAEEALRRGDLATYQREIEAARALIEEALELSGAGGDGGA